MSVRDDLAAYAITTRTVTEDGLAPLLDAYREEVLAKAIGRLRAIPVDCTALTGPIWYGDGWNSAITCLEEIADYQTPDDEAYPGELQRLRMLALQLRVAVIRKGDLANAEWLLAVYEDHRKQASGATPTTTPDFFQPGHTYSREHHGDTAEFDVRSIETAPDGGQLAFGFYRRQPHTSWHPYSSDDLADWADTTGEVTA